MKIYSDAVDKNVERIIVFIKHNDRTINIMGSGAVLCYKDVSCTQPITNAELFDYFIKGMAVQLPTTDIEDGVFANEFVLCTNARVIDDFASTDTMQRLTMVLVEDGMCIVGCDLDAFNPTEVEPGPEIPN